MYLCIHIALFEVNPNFPWFYHNLLLCIYYACMHTLCVFGSVTYVLMHPHFRSSVCMSVRHVNTSYKGRERSSEHLFHIFIYIRNAFSNKYKEIRSARIWYIYLLFRINNVYKWENTGKELKIVLKRSFSLEYGSNPILFYLRYFRNEKRGKEEINL